MFNNKWCLGTARQLKKQSQNQLTINNSRLMHPFTTSLSVLKSLLYCFAVIFTLASVSLNALSQTTPDSLFDDTPSFLKVEEAFGFDYEQRGGELIVKWDIAEGYYLYKKQFKTVTKNVVLEETIYPDSEQIEDEFFGVSEVFLEDMQMVLPIISAEQDGSVKLRFQGCAEAGLCYPPTTKVIYLDEFNAASGAGRGGSSSNPTFVDNSDASASENKEVVSSQFTLAERLLSDQSIFISLGLLTLLGLGLAFTPCVYPMYPILSAIVIGKGKTQIKTSQAFALSFVYVQGMAITYSILGLIVASAGVQFQAALQHPVLLSIFILLFVLLALAMFGLYEIQLPAKWQQKLNNLSNEQKQGNYLGVFVMGVISGLVASPCTTAPLTAVLIVVAQSDSLVFGFSALYALSIGMGIPLILFGITGGKLLPKAGNWMNVIKVTFGFMMLTVAILFVERVLVSDLTNFLWAGLGLAAFTYLFTVNQSTSLSFGKGVRTVITASGLIMSVLYTTQQLQRFDWFPTLLATQQDSAQSENTHPEWQVVRNLADFETKLANANSEGKTVMIDLYADWCVACKEFEKYTFPDQAVVAALADTVWMQIDLTDNTPSNLEFQKRFDIKGLPTIMFFDMQGQEIERARVTGFMDAENFAEHSRKALISN